MGTKDFQCQICPSAFNNEGHLKVHVRGQHMDDKHQCLQCKKLFNYKHHLKKHIEEVHLGKIYECEVCKHKVSSKSAFQYHINTVHKEIDFKCKVDECDFKAKAKNALQLHVRSFHQGEKNFHCSLCNYKSFRKHDLKNHIENIHEDPKKCPTCGKFYSSNKGLQRHKKIHNENMHIMKFCQFCDFSTKEKLNLKKHIEVQHHGIMLLKCSECFKSYKSIRNLKLHMDAIHRKVKYKCHICEKEFSYKTALDRHNERLHSDAVKNLIKCNLCPYATLFQMDFNQHVKIHKDL